VLEHLGIELAVPTEGVFRLDLSELDGPDELAADATDSYTWTPILPHATAVTIRRGLVRDKAWFSHDVGELVVRVLGEEFDPVENLDVRAGVTVRAVDGEGRPIFTGTIEDADSEHRKPGDGKSSTTLVAVDAVRDVANTPRYGAANPGAEWETTPSRFARLLGSSPVPWRIEDALPGRPVDYRPTFTTPAQALAEAGHWSGDGVVSVPGSGPARVRFSEGVNGDTLSRTLTGLTPGRPYVLELRLTVEATGAPGVQVLMDGQTVNLTQVGPAVVRVAFTPTGTTQPLSLTIYNTGTVADLTGIILAEWNPHYQANIVHESDLASHLNIAGATGRTVWYVDAAGTLVVAPEYPWLDDEPVAHFSDDGTGTHGYVGAVAGFGTADLVTSVELDNHRRAWDEEAGDWRADDQRLGPWIDHTARATYGHRRATVETAVADTGIPWAVSPAELAAAYLEAGSEVSHRVRQLRWNAAEDYSLVHRLETWAVVLVTHRGSTRRYRIVHTDHEISPRRWIVTLTLTPEVV
jgi:hypothetical protein